MAGGVGEDPEEATGGSVGKSTVRREDVEAVRILFADSVGHQMLIKLKSQS